jgi:hypothetical protein
VLGLLLTSSLLSIAVIGYGGGVAHERRTALTWALTLLIGSVLWITIDLDRPRQGWMQLSDEPLKALKFDDAGP